MSAAARRGCKQQEGAELRGLRLPELRAANLAEIAAVARGTIEGRYASGGLVFSASVKAPDSRMEAIKKKLQQEIAALEYELRTELPKEIAKARAHGDLSENAEYHAAKERQSFVDARLSQLKKRLGEFSMIDMSKIPQGKVGLGSTVLLMDLDKNEEVQYKLTTSEEANVQAGLISTSSPIGKSLLNKEVGDVVRIHVPGGVKEVEIISLKTIHDT
jgi:transcription elongation factor GreA